jgi:acetylornithine deacetylase/succinyl-diaminopimelate desuccinylase-like protein
MRSTHWLVCACLLFATAGRAEAAVDIARLEQEAVDRLQQYLRIDTSNPPGNEQRGVDFLGGLLDAEGIDYETAESAPGRGNLWARLGGGSEPALVLLHHIDVVPAEREYWSVDPFGGEIRNGYLYGRGAIDTKSLGILELQAFIGLFRSGKPLTRPVIFLATADEEAGGAAGAGWMVANRPQVFADATLLLNEGGAGLDLGERQIVNVEVTQKVPLWLRLTVEDRPGHGSAPHLRSAVTRLIAALDRLSAYEFKPRLIPAVESYLKARAAAGVGPFAERLADPAAALESHDFRVELRIEDPQLSAITQDTCAITRLEGSNKVNVIPPSATAELDCRLLPDQDPEAFVNQLATVLNDDGIRIETLLNFTPAVSTTDSPLYQAIRDVTARNYPEAVVLPAVSAGFTDSHYFRDLGVVAYGWSPMMLTRETLATVHGNDERISVENVRRGTRMMYQLLEQLTHESGAGAKGQ